MRKIILFLMVITVTCPLVTWGISRVGGGSVKSERQGFVLEAPPLFRSISIQGEQARFEGPRGLGLGLFSSQRSVNLLEFRSEYPNLVKLSRLALASQLKQEGWRLLKTKVACMEAFAKESDSASYAIVTWGEGFGIVLVGDKSAMSRSAIEEMVVTLRIEEASCRWK